MKSENGIEDLEMSQEINEAFKNYIQEYPRSNILSLCYL